MSDRDGIVRGPLEPGTEAWAILFEDPDHGNETFFGEGAAEAALRRFEQARQTWNCTLFRQYAPMGWATPEARGAQPLPTLPLNDGNGPWCGCGQRLGHAVPNVDCDPLPETRYG